MQENTYPQAEARRKAKPPKSPPLISLMGIFAADVTRAGEGEFCSSCDYIHGAGTVTVEQPARNSGPPEQSTSEDLRLVADVLVKDRKATAEFVARYSDCIYGYVRRRVMPRAELVDDLVQEVFLAAWQGLRQFRGEAGLRPWLLGIARHKVEEYYRRRLREAVWPENDDGEPMEPAVFPLFEEELDRNAVGASVRRTMDLLPEMYSLALLWRYLEGRSVREMAELTGKTEKAMERLLARARESFRRSWQSARQAR